MDDSEQQERMKKMEREYERRQQEILLEAEAAVRAREEALNQVSEIISFLEFVRLVNFAIQELGRLREELERQKAAHQVCSRS